MLYVCETERGEQAELKHRIKDVVIRAFSRAIGAFMCFSNVTADQFIRSDSDVFTKRWGCSCGRRFPNGVLRRSFALIVPRLPVPTIFGQWISSIASLRPGDRSAY